jgi:hypothetical protein
VGAYQADPSGKPNAGKSYVIFGKTDTDAVDLSKQVNSGVVLFAEDDIGFACV